VNFHPVLLPFVSYLLSVIDPISDLVPLKITYYNQDQGALLKLRSKKERKGKKKAEREKGRKEGRKEGGRRERREKKGRREKLEYHYSGVFKYSRYSVHLLVLNLRN
jgi:hypothetical protein